MQSNIGRQFHENAKSVGPYSRGSHHSRSIAVLRTDHPDVKLLKQEWIKLVTRSTVVPPTTDHVTGGVTSSTEVNPTFAPGRRHGDPRVPVTRPMFMQFPREQGIAMTRLVSSAIIVLFLAVALSTVGPKVTRGDEVDAPSFVVGNDEVRVHIVTDGKQRYVVNFEVKATEGWARVAGYPADRPWTVYSGWKDSWYAEPHSIGVQQVERGEGGQVIASATASIDGQPWRFSDTYSLEAALIKVERTFEHLSDARQEKITLATRVRFPLGKEPRMLLPGSIYNGNPSSTLPGPRLSYEPNTIGLYEEHRYPIPMVNVESTVAGRRLHGTLVTDPGKIAMGHKGDDHWWSLGLEYGDGYVDLTSVSGPVATNGKKSTIYGHRNGFDSYDDAYLDVAGRQQFKKTFYLDIGLGQKKGYAFRPGLWKAFELFQPVDRPGVDFSNAMALKAKFAKSTFYRASPDVAGFCAWGWPNRHFQFGWCGCNIAISYGLLSHAHRTGDQQALRQAVDTISFFAENSEQDVKGMLYGDYLAVAQQTSIYNPEIKPAGWKSALFHGAKRGISSRQLGETLERMAEAIILARKMKLDDEADRWEATLRRGCDFLVRSKRPLGMFPRAWNTDGSARGWDDEGQYDPKWLSAAGSFCVGPLVRMWQFSGEKKYLDLAEEVLTSYWRQFGEDQSTPPWGGTHDAGAEDKEAGWGLMKAALDVYEATHDRRYLEWAQLAADWTLTWMYFHNVGMPRSDLLRDHMNTIGWTFISTQNQEIDVFGYWMAPDYYRLGRMLKDDRYKQIGKVLFDAATQTIAREGAMFGQISPGIQAEHYNHSNCTYVKGGRWRGEQFSIGISWVLGATLYGGAKLAELDADQFAWTDKANRPIAVPTSRRNPINWRYTHEQPKEGWHQADFDDASWKQGPGGFGEYSMPGSVIGTLWDVEQKQIWLRRPFTLKERPSDPRLVVHHSDAAKIYVNGVLAAELSDRQSRYETVGMNPEAVAALREGSNVFAVTCHDEDGVRYIDVGLIDAAP